MWSAGLWRRVVLWVNTKVSEEHIASFFKVWSHIYEGAGITFLRNKGNIRQSAGNTSTSLVTRRQVCRSQTPSASRQPKEALIFVASSWRIHVLIPLFSLKPIICVPSNVSDALQVHDSQHFNSDCTSTVYFILLVPKILHGLKTDHIIW